LTIRHRPPDGILKEEFTVKHFGITASSDTTNEDRAQWAKHAVDEFRRVTGTDAECAVLDLLADLMHLQGEQFEDDLQMARTHYDAELEEDTPRRKNAGTYEQLCDDEPDNGFTEPFDSDGYCNACCVVTNGNCKHGKPQERDLVRIGIHVKGGMVQDVRSSTPHVEYFVADEDVETDSDEMRQFTELPHEID
jgi:hypothetical protein